MPNIGNMHLEKSLAYTLTESEQNDFNNMIDEINEKISIGTNIKDGPSWEEIYYAINTSKLS